MDDLSFLENGTLRQSSPSSPHIEEVEDEDDDEILTLVGDDDENDENSISTESDEDSVYDIMDDGSNSEIEDDDYESRLEKRAKKLEEQNRQSLFESLVYGIGTTVGAFILNQVTPFIEKLIKFITKCCKNNEQPDTNNIDEEVCDIVRDEAMDTFQDAGSSSKNLASGGSNGGGGGGGNNQTR